MAYGSSRKNFGGQARTFGSASGRKRPARRMSPLDEFFGGGVTEDDLPFATEKRTTNEIALAVDYINRVLSVQGEINLLQDDVKEIYREASDAGLDVDMLKEVVSRRRKSLSAAERASRDEAISNVEAALHEETFDDDEDP